MVYVCFALSCMAIVLALCTSGIIAPGIPAGLFVAGLYFILQAFYSAIKNISKSKDN